MRIRSTRRSLVGAIVVLFAIVFIVWSAVIRNSIANAVPAGARHIHAVAHVPPDDSPDDPSANNLSSTPFMTRGYCYAGSQLKDTEAAGGFSESSNAAQKVRARSNTNALLLLAQPGVSMSFAGGPGMRVTLVNNTQDLLAFDASDSRLAIVQEAQDTDGNWKPVEYLEASDCGNSYHRVFLASNHFWAFAAPRYTGIIPTKLRFAMALADGSRLHSNTFDGSVNPNQFTVKRGSQ